jgi:uncharacterized membrane protein
VTQASTPRQPSIDIMRAVAITLMVIVHFVENLSGWWGTDGGPFAGSQRGYWLPAGFAAPIFTFLTGTSYRIWLGGQRRRGKSEESITKSTVRRGLFLISLGFAFNVLVWLPEDVFNWDVLTLIGLAMLLLAAMRSAPDAAILLAALLLVALTPPLQAVTGYLGYWANGYYDYEFTLADVGIGWLVVGYFPLFPWLAYPLAGYAVGPAVFENAGPRPRRRPLLVAAGLLAASVAAAVAWQTWPPLAALSPLSSWTMFPPSLAYVCGTLGGVIAAGVVAHATVDRSPGRWTWLIGWATPLSRHALSIYLLHHFVHVWPLWAYGAAIGDDMTAPWQVAMPPWASLALALVFMAAASVLFHWVDRRRIGSIEAAMRWLCD